MTVKKAEILTHALIDSGATGIAFVDQDIARHHERPLEVLKEKKHVRVIDGRPIESGDITHIVNVGMKAKDHKEQLPMIVTQFRHYPIILGIRWLQLHAVVVRFASNTITSGSQYYITHCYDALVTVQGVTEEPPDCVNLNTT